MADQQDKKRRKARDGDGTIFWDKSKQCYVGKISLGYKPDGTRNRPKVEGRTKTIVRAKLKQLKDEHDAGIELGDKYTVEQAARDWLARGLRGRNASTVGKLTSLTEKHIIARLGKAKLKKLTADDVDDFLDGLTSRYATSVISLILGTLRRIIRFAEARNKVGRNVAMLVDAPKGTDGRPSKSMTLDQAKAVLRASRGSWIHPYIALSVFTGVRTEEARPLKWENTHLNPVKGQVCSCGTKHPETEAPYVEVWRSVRLGGDTKTQKSRRTIALPSFVVSILTAYRVHEELEREEAGRSRERMVFVFATSNNTERDPANVRRDLRAVVAAAEVPGNWTPREFRHTFVSLMSDQGANEELIADLVGHKRTSTTRTVYRHQLRPVVTKGAELLDRAFKDGLVD
ncbi:tyrosine-type recombinase/integrase [Glycomyces tenuis]|uniref:tyrosine-type recombinase/integrase n=1 Tax=Glycomyces tenuis TaxID=58116 RepID=UPI0004792C71|nr:site-specific integrase [Glycomyces tenuis]